MPFSTLSSVVQASPTVINSSLEKLSCSGCNIDEVDIYPAALSALTAKGAPRSVAEEVRALMVVARQNRSAAPASATASSSRRAATAKNQDSYLESFNVGIAMSLHTVLLSRNRIGKLLGIVQFRHCVRLSLLGNRIRTIEDCEPLAMLPDLQYLSLEYNPVAQLPHYRAHLLRICSWPHELAPRTCRLQKLDSTPVSLTEVKHAALCLHRELVLMPELLSRMQLLAFLGDVEKKHAMHRELRQRGIIFQEASEKVTLEATLERGAAYALDRVPVSGAAHLVRVVVRDRHHPKEGVSLYSCSTASPAGSSSPQALDLNVKARIAAGQRSRTATAVDVSTTATFPGSDDLDTSNIASVSSMASCSLVTDAPEGDAQLLHSLSTILGSKELEWSQAALRRADAAEARSTCTGWSRDAFRQTLAFLDVRVCAALLRLSRFHGSALDAHEVDRLCQVWLHAVTHCAPTDRVAQCNATGPRRFFNGSGHLAGSRRTQAVQERGVPATSIARAATSTKPNTGGGSIDKTPSEGEERSRRAPSPARRLPVEAAAQTRKNVWEVGDQDGYLSASSASSLPLVSNDISIACTDISTASLSSDSLMLPREAAPQPTAAGWRLSSCTAPAQQLAVLPFSNDERPSIRSATTASGQAPSLARTSSSSAEAIATLDSVAEKLNYQRVRRHTFQQWCTALRHRWQSRIAAGFIHKKVSEAARQHSFKSLRSPSWMGLLTHVTYLERKRGFFNCWRKRAEDARVMRAKGVASIQEACGAAAKELPFSVRVQQLEAKHAADTQLSTTRALFLAWRSKAEGKALSRCAAARHRVRAEPSQTPDTFLTLPQQSYIARMGLPARSPSSSPVVPRPLLEDLLQASDKRVNVALSSPSPGFHRCGLVGLGQTKVASWKPASMSASASPAGDSPHTTVEDEDGISPVAPSSIDGVSVNSVATPFPPSTYVVPRDAFSGSGAHDPHRPLQKGHEYRELSPPPAIRILFPTNAMTPMQPSPPLQTHPSLSVGAAAGGKSAARLYGGTQPSRLPSTAAARRAIRTSAVASHSPAAASPCEKHARQDQTCPSPPSPYPVEDVEALVARSVQLEADRVFLLSEVRKLSAAGERTRASSHVVLPETPRSPLVQSEGEECGATQQREIRRLESIVAALRDERRSLLTSVKRDIFHY